MSLISKLTPINLLEEKAKFLANPKYNPHFVYEEPVNQKTLTKYGLPQTKYSNLAKEILDRSYFGRNEQDLFMMEGKSLSQKEVDKKVKEFLKLHQLAKKYRVVWSSSFVSRASTTSDAIKLRLPADFKKEGLMGMLYHEIGTHALRRINYEKQPWFKKKKELGFADHLLTEEGLAVLHALIPHTYKMAYTSAIRYLAVSYAQTHTFAEVWEFLKRYINDEERRWNITFRVKRGITDTSDPSGFTKDLLYLQGAVEVWRWLKNHNFDISKLYLGKIAAEDAEKAFQMNPNFRPLLPIFFFLDKKKYQENINEIGEVNQFVWT